MSARGVEVGTSRYGLEVGAPGLGSVGPITFGPDGILFVADNANAAIFAIDVGDATAVSDPAPIDVENLTARLAAYLGCGTEDLSVRGLAVRPLTQEPYLSVLRGNGAAAVPLIVKITTDGDLALVALDDVPYSQTTVEGAPAEDDERLEARVGIGDEGEEFETKTGLKLRVVREPLRHVTVTDLAYVDGVLLVAGASNEEFVSTLRRIPFPFGGEAVRNSLEIFHVSHGKYETHSPIRTFVPYGDGASILASYTCTPVVHFSLADFQPGAHVMGKTVAELGNGNTPLDMVSYTRDGDEYLLVANSRHPLLKIACGDIDRQESLTEPGAPGEPSGAPAEKLPHEGVTRMAARNGHVLMLQRDTAGALHLRSYSNASL